MLKRLDRRLVYEGGILDFYRDTMQLPDGRVEEWDYLKHKKGGGACAVPVLEDGRILMIRQFRPAVDRETLELPAGARDGGEDSAVTAARELMEETGMRAEKLVYLASLDTAAAYCSETTDIYIAKGLAPCGGQRLDEAEEISVEAWELDALLAEIRAGRIRDAKTVAGITGYACAR